MNRNHRRFLAMLGMALSVGANVATISALVLMSKQMRLDEIGRAQQYQLADEARERFLKLLHSVGEIAVKLDRAQVLEGKALTYLTKLYDLLAEVLKVDDPHGPQFGRTPISQSKPQVKVPFDKSQITVASPKQ